MQKHPRQHLQRDSAQLDQWLSTHARSGSRLVGPLLSNQGVLVADAEHETKKC